MSPADCVVDEAMMLPAAALIQNVCHDVAGQPVGTGRPLEDNRGVPIEVNRDRPVRLWGHGDVEVLIVCAQAVTLRTIVSKRVRARQRPGRVGPSNDVLRDVGRRLAEVYNQVLGTSKRRTAKNF